MRLGTKFKDDIQQIERVAGRAGSDTIRLWEGYKEQAYLWRALALLQMPATVIALFAAILAYYASDTVLEIPLRPQPGFYSAKDLSDSAFISVATELANLLATYNPDTVDEQFYKARGLLWEPALSDFQDYVNREIPTIKKLRRSQAFYAPPQLAVVLRSGSVVRVFLRGEMRYWFGKKSPEVKELTYEFVMKTKPRSLTNKFGVVITDVRVHVVKS